MYIGKTSGDSPLGIPPALRVLTRQRDVEKVNHKFAENFVISPRTLAKDARSFSSELSNLEMFSPIVPRAGQSITSRREL